MTYFRPDGTVRCIDFRPQRGTRPHGIRVAVAGRETMFGLASSDFTAQYTRAVDTLLDWLDQFENEDLRQQMLAAQDAFLARYKLGLRPVTLQVLATVDGQPA